MAPKYEIIGLAALRRDLKRFEGGIADLKEANAAAAKIVADGSQRTVPVRSGVLKSTIRSSGTQRAGVVRAGKSAVPYAGPIHFGWAGRNIRPQPFVYEAFDARVDDVHASYETQIDALIAKYDLR